MTKFIQYFWHIRWLWSLGVLAAFGWTVFGETPAPEGADPWEHYVVDVVHIGAPLSLGVDMMMDHTVQQLPPPSLPVAGTAAQLDLPELGELAMSAFPGSVPVIPSLVSSPSLLTSPLALLPPPWITMDTTLADGHSSHVLVFGELTTMQEQGRYTLLAAQPVPSLENIDFNARRDDDLSYQQQPAPYSPHRRFMWRSVAMAEAAAVFTFTPFTSLPASGTAPQLRQPELQEEALLGTAAEDPVESPPASLVWEPSTFMPAAGELAAAGELPMGLGGPALKLTVSSPLVASPPIRRMELTTIEHNLSQGFYPQLLQASLPPASGL